MNFFETSEQSESYLNINGESNNVLFLAFNGLGRHFGIQT